MVLRCTLEARLYPEFVVVGLHVSLAELDNLALVRSSPAGDGAGVLAAIGSYIPHDVRFRHWTASHILTNSTHMKLGNGHVGDKPISTLGRRKPTPVTLYVTP